ncbi:6-phosphofructokinase, partial [Pseudoloma neurophilia]
MNFSIICNDQTLFETRKFYETLGFNCEIVQKSDNLSELFLKENKKLKIKNGIIELSTTENLDQIVTWSAHRNDSTENMSNSLTETESSDQTSKIKGAGPSATILMPRQLSEHEKTSFITDILKIYDPNMNELHLTHSYGNFQTFSQRKAIFDKKTVHSTVNVPILSDSKSKRCRIGVLTSGGDSPGMNTCLGTILKLGKRYDIDIICFKNGFKGLVNDEIIDLSHLEDDKEDFCKTEICIGQSLCQIVESAKTEKLVEHLSFLINPQTFNFNTAGTLIGTARCEEFKTESGLKSAIKTVMKNDLTGLIMMGGDGTMRGGKLLAERYFEFAKEIAKNDTISKNEIAKFIKVIHIPFSIDNDIPSAYTIGTDTALQTICDSSVILHSTFSAHNRLYVMEVMGRDSHYLSTVSGVCFADYIIYDTFSHNSNDSGCSESDWITPLITKVKSCPKKCVAVVLSESAHLCETHHQKMAEKLVQEGVLTEQQIANCPKSSNTECQIKRISCNYVKDITNQYIDSRVLTLGHLQRGCKPVAYDRIISVLSGVEAVDQILNLFNLSVSLSNKENSLETDNEKMNEMTKPVSIILNHNHLIKRDLANLLNRIENKLTESSMKDHIERVVRMDINKMSCSGRFLLDNLLPDKQN